MKTAGIAIITALSLLASGCDNPFQDDGDETEDAQVIATYTQTVSTASQDTTIAPDVDIDGNNNSVIIIVGDDNAPDNSNRHDEIPADPTTEPEPEVP